MAQIYSTCKEFNPEKSKKIFKALAIFLFLICFTALLMILGFSLYEKLKEPVSCHFCYSR